MRRLKLIIIIVVAASTLTWLIYARSQTLGSTAQTPQAQKQTPQQLQQFALGTQQRLNRYFHSDVIPKLGDCWQRVQGEGMVETKITFIKARGNWIWQSVDVSSSTLPRGQAAVASQCMQEAVRGTSFPVEEGDRVGNIKGGDKYVVNWNWPVPLPANAAEFRIKSGGKTGGCDGHGAPAKCYNCTRGSNLQCFKVCVGWESCTSATSTKECFVGDNCASGGPFGGVGGVIMY